MTRPAILEIFGHSALALVMIFCPLNTSLALAQTAVAAGTTPVPSPSLRAEVRTPRAVWAYIGGMERSFDPSAYRLVDSAGRDVPIARILPNTASETLIVPAVDLDLTQSYFLEIPAASLTARVRPDGWFRSLFSNKPLGANVASDGSKTVFGIFSPRATGVKLYLYNSPDAQPTTATQVIDMIRDQDGVWEASVPRDLHGAYYDFTVHGHSGPGMFFYETNPVHISDPYARANVEAQGKSRVMRATTPATPLARGIPKMEDVVAYEVHIEDFTRQLPVAPNLQGTIPAFTMPGLRNAKGEKIGFDHIVDLGVNVVHLLPMQEFLHYPEAEWQAAFGNDPEMKRLGVDQRSYEWGYRTTHAFAIENTYRQRGTDYGAERAQFRDLVQAFHNKGIAVIVDIVPNHTGENMDARNMLFNFNVLDRDYYYRTNDAGNHIGVFGNEVKTEDRPMTQRWLIDQARSLIAEFGIDGFRIDLAGQIDQQTLIALRAAVGPNIIIYGEPWIDVSDPIVRANPDWDWYKEDAPITFFQDDTRNALVGSPFRLEDKATDRGYAGGNVTQRGDAIRAISNNWADEKKSTNQGMNYADIHDNWTLADRFATRDWNGSLGVDAGSYRLVAGYLLTSLGPIVLHGGSEMLRSKGSAPLGEVIRRTATGPIYFKGRQDTYNVRTPNEYVWSDLGKTIATGASNDYSVMNAWWRGLIRFRNSDAGRVFRIANPPSANYFKWITPQNQALLGYIVDDKVLILSNVGSTAGAFDGINLPAGRWRKIADGTRIDHLRGVRGPDANLVGGTLLTLNAPPTSFQMWVKADR
jgi:Carbohydrate-binding module 48 (Isoamylase N-terminal domain)/Alpha amylase, catalytic domain